MTRKKMIANMRVMQVVCVCVHACIVYVWNMCAYVCTHASVWWCTLTLIML